MLSAPAEISADYREVIAILHHYACVNLFVIPNAHPGVISLNPALPFAFRLSTGKTITKGDLPVHLDEPSVITKEHYQIVQQILAKMNTVLTKMIPGLSIDIHNFGEQLLETGAAGYKIELISKRGDVCISYLQTRLSSHKPYRSCALPAIRGVYLQKVDYIMTAIEK